MTLKQKATINKLKDKIDKMKENRKYRRRKNKEEKKDSREIEMIEYWIKANLKDISMEDFFMHFNKLYNLEFKKIRYDIKNIGKLKLSQIQNKAKVSK